MRRGRSGVFPTLGTLAHQPVNMPHYAQPIQTKSKEAGANEKNRCLQRGGLFHPADARAIHRTSPACRYQRNENTRNLGSRPLALPATRHQANERRACRLQLERGATRGRPPRSGHAWEPREPSSRCGNVVANESRQGGCDRFGTHRPASCRSSQPEPAREYAYRTPPAFESVCPRFWTAGRVRRHGAGNRAIAGTPCAGKRVQQRPSLSAGVFQLRGEAWRLASKSDGNDTGEVH